MVTGRPWWIVPVVLGLLWCQDYNVDPYARRRDDMRHIFKVWIFGTNKENAKRYRMEWLASATSGLGAVGLVKTDIEVIQTLMAFDNLDEWKHEDMGVVCELDTREVPMAKGAEVSP